MSQFVWVILQLPKHIIILVLALAMQGNAIYLVLCFLDEVGPAIDFAFGLHVTRVAAFPPDEGDLEIGWVVVVVGLTTDCPPSILFLRVW